MTIVNTKPTALSRRRLIVNTALYGGGFALTVALPGMTAKAANLKPAPWAEPTSPAMVEFTPWIAIAPDDTVTVRVATPEIGNGVMTQSAMSVTEELHCDWAKIRVEFASTDRDYRENIYSTHAGPQPWFAGRSTNGELLQTLLQAGASARERLKAAAAAQWGAPVAEIQAENSRLTHRPTGRVLRYGEVAAKAGTIELAVEPTPKPQSDWTLLGKASPFKLQLPQIVNGSAIYGIDVRLPGMVYAALKQSPVHGGRLKSFDAEAVMHMPGVRAVVTVDPTETVGSPMPHFAYGGENTAIRAGIKAGDGWVVVRDSHVASAAQHGIAVIADHYWQARKALDALPVEWEAGDGAHWVSTEQIYEAGIAAVSHEGERIDTARGDMAQLERQKNVVDATYRTPYCDQMHMEPLNGTALVTKDRVDVWHPTQESQQAFWVAVDETGIAPENVYFHQTFVGGAFGRRVYGNDVRMVVAVARKFPGVPVQVIWSREETTRQGRYRAMITARLKAGLDETGMPKAFLARAAGHGFSPSGLRDSYIAGLTPNVHIELQRIPLHILTGPFRGPGYNSNAFIVETFIDECAVAAKIDPLDYRLKLLADWPDKGWIKCLREAAAKAGWGKTLPKGMGQGVAIANFAMSGKPQTTVCAIATVEVTRKGELKIQAIDLAFDCGGMLNRDAVLSQIQGGAIFGLNMALNEELTVKNGEIVEGNFDAYPVLRMGDAPKMINIHFGGLSGDQRFSIIGEAPIGPIGPAIGNAIFRATGKRIRAMPFRKQDLSWA